MRQENWKRDEGHVFTLTYTQLNETWKKKKSEESEEQHLDDGEELAQPTLDYVVEWWSRARPEFDRFSPVMVIRWNTL